MGFHLWLKTMVLGGDGGRSLITFHGAERIEEI